MRSFVLVAILAPFAAALVPACTSIPDLQFPDEGDGGRDANAPDGGGPETSDGALSDGTTGDDGPLLGDAPVDAPQEAATTCNGVPADACCGGVACVDKTGQGRCALCADCLLKHCTNAKICCYNSQGSLDCRPSTGCN